MARSASKKVKISGGNHFVLDAADHKDVVRDFTNLRYHGDGRGYGSVVGTDEFGARTVIARAIVDAFPGEQVRYVDGNPFDLRRRNLRIVGR